MKALEDAVRSIEQDGLLWGSSKLVAIGYGKSHNVFFNQLHFFHNVHYTGIKKLQITLVIEDEKVSLDELQEKVAEFEDFVQSTDVAAMQSAFFFQNSRATVDSLPLQSCRLSVLCTEDLSCRVVLYQFPF